MTRTKIQIDFSEVERLSGIGLSNKEVANALGIAEATLYRRKQDNESFESALKKGRAKAAADIANAVYENAMKGNITAQIWYEKTRRGLSDKVQIDGDVEIKLNYEWKPKEQRPEAGDQRTLDERNP
jgi:uncharacterized protein (DUF2384 family)